MIKLHHLVFGVILCAAVGSQAVAEKPPVYVWQGKAWPEKVFVQWVGTKAEIQAVQWGDAYLMLAETVRAAKCNGVVNFKIYRVAKANQRKAFWEATADIVTFRNPEKLDNRSLVVMR